MTTQQNPAPVWGTFRGPTRTLLVSALVLALLLMIGMAYHLLLVIFAGILAATFVRTLSIPLHRLTRLPHGLAVVVVALAFAGLFSLAGMYIAPHVAVQANELQQQLPAAIDGVQVRIRSHPLGSELLSQVPAFGDLLRSRRVLEEVRGIFTVTIGVFADLFIFFFISLYLTFDPVVYLNGMLALVPPGSRRRAAEVFTAVARTLRKWLLGTLISMASTGAITGLGLWLLGIPLALTLGLLAGLLTFIPYIGGIVSAVPAVLLALLDRPVIALSVAGIYLLAHTVEAYVVTPLIQQRQVHLPPVLTLFAQVVLGSAAGFLGLMLATPITAALLTVVKMLYIEDVLGEGKA